VSAHVAATDPHPVYVTAAELPAVPAVADAGEVADCSTVAESDGTSPRYARADHVHKYVDTSGSGTNPAWYGALHAAYGNCDPHRMLDMMYNNPVNATPTNISTSVARIAYFRPPANITVNKIRGFGVGATTNVYRTAIYRASDLARLTAELPFTTVAQAWFAAGSGLNLALVAGTLYFIAVSVNATGTTAGCLCFTATTGRIGVLPASWPGNLDIDLATPIIEPRALAQFTVTSGALPATAGTIAAQAAWTGGMPALLLDANNA
jgi:hypothetical protein